jgi:uncharacterized protein involved in exopolysaccharide biosynthesis
MTMPLQLTEIGRDPELPGAALEAPLLPEILRLLRQYGRAYLALIVTVTSVAVVVSFLLPARYKATASLMAVGSGMPQGAIGRLARLASISPSRHELPAETLCTILRSRRISDPILDRTFERWPGDPRPLPLRNLITRTAPGEEPPRDKLYRRLARSTRFSMDPETRIVSLAVETRYPHLSAQVANAYLEAVRRYATEEQQARSQLIATLVNDRMKEVGGEITVAEDALHRFLAANQNYATSSDPDIRIEQLRLERNLELKSRMLIDLTTQHEMAVLEERNEASLIQIIDRGAAPDLRSWPVRRLIVAAALVGSVALGFVMILVADHFGVCSLRDVRARIAG